MFLGNSNAHAYFLNTFIKLEQGSDTYALLESTESVLQYYRNNSSCPCQATNRKSLNTRGEPERERDRCPAGRACPPRTERRRRQGGVSWACSPSATEAGPRGRECGDGGGAGGGARQESLCVRAWRVEAADCSRLARGSHQPDRMSAGALFSTSSSTHHQSGSHPYGRHDE